MVVNPGLNAVTNIINYFEFRHGERSEEGQYWMLDKFFRIVSTHAERVMII